jgi:hypothetical protein
MDNSTKDVIIKSINRSNKGGGGDDLFSQLAAEINRIATQNISSTSIRKSKIYAQIQFATQFSMRH